MSDQTNYRSETMQMAYLIPGWMWPVELGWLYDTFGSSQAHLEIGTYCGKSLFTVACAMGQQEIPVPALCVGVDPLGGSALGAAWEKQILQATLTAIADRAGFPAEWWEMTSVSAMRIARENRLSFDSIFIDANHHFAEAKADIEGWLPFLRPGGIIAGHDYWPADPGVMSAVNEVFPYGFEVQPNTRIWWKRISSA